VARAERARYSNYVKDQVRKRYHLCRTTADKQALADELQIGSVPKLYNLASRLGATGKESTPSDSAQQGRGQEVHNIERLVNEREDPDTIEFSKEDDRYLKAEFGRRTVEAISYHLHHSETAILYRARHLELRKPVKYWRIDKVAPWLGMTVAEFRELQDEGIDIYPLGDLNKRVVLEVVSTTSLGRWMALPEKLDWLRENEADDFFVREIMESIDDLVNRKTEFERCKFLSHGHVCQNPFTENSFGLFCTNTDRQVAGEDPRCSVRTLAIEDLRPDWA
jgi:hypothetical protein